MERRIFISYHHRDLEGATRLREELDALRLPSLLIDVNLGTTGRRLIKDLRRLITEHCSALVAFEGSNFRDTTWTRLERKIAAKENLPIVRIRPTAEKSSERSRKRWLRSTMDTVGVFVLEADDRAETEVARNVAKLVSAFPAGGVKNVSVIYPISIVVLAMALGAVPVGLMGLDFEERWHGYLAITFGLVGLALFNRLLFRAERRKGALTLLLHRSRAPSVLTVLGTFAVGRKRFREVLETWYRINCHVSAFRRFSQ